MTEKEKPPERPFPLAEYSIVTQSNLFTDLTVLKFSHKGGKMEKESHNNQGKEMTTPLDIYLSAVACRKSLKGDVVNYAILQVLERDDVPRHQEIIRILWQYVWAIAELAPGDFEGNEELCCNLVTRAHEAMEKVNELSNAGCSARIGTYEPLNDLKNQDIQVI